MAVVYLLLYFKTGSPLFLQERVGRHQQPFTIIKFRTMPLDTPSVGTHLVDQASLPPFFLFLRKYKIDEFPQFINVMKGEMGLVGPRPCLFNQTVLIEARDANGVFAVRPGITGLAQINGVDMSTPQKLAEWDREMIQTMSVGNYFRYLLRTFF